MRRGLTLIEMLIALSLFAMILVSVLFIIASVGKRIRLDIDEARLVTEMNYALDTIKKTSTGASTITENFIPDPSCDEHHPDAEVPDCTYYHLNYFVESAGTLIKHKVYLKPVPIVQNGKTVPSFAIVLDKGGIEETLVGAFFHPAISFTHAISQEPHYFTVTISGTINRSGNINSGERKTIARTTGVRLWYTEVLR